MRLFFLLISAFLVASTPSEREGLKRVQAHLLIEDATSALEEARALFARFPQSKEVASAFIEALSASGFEGQAIAMWDRLSQSYPDLIEDRHLLEELSWCVLRNGIESTQYGVRLAALIGAYLTRDVRAVPILQKMMDDSNAVIRSVAIQMAGAYSDAPLKSEIARLMDEEKMWIVRLEVIRSAGALRMRELVPSLKRLVQSEKTTYEERQLAVGALLQIYDQISSEEWEALAASNRAGLRYFACSIAEHFHPPEAKEGIVQLISDSSPDVRIAALNAFGLSYREQFSSEEAKKILAPHLKDPTPAVAITAAWAALLIDPDLGKEVLAKWLGDSLPENRRLAASALASTGERGLTLAAKTLRESRDPYVRANVALGLLGQREEVALSCDTLIDFLKNEKRMWMWDTQQNPLFQVLAPSQVRHVDHIPNYPEAIDQMTRLNLLSLLVLVEDPRAFSAVKEFLQKERWGITGVAAATLLQEGDESALEVVRELLNDSDPNVRLQACLTLALFGRDETVLNDLQRAYADADHERKLHILEALGRIGTARSYPFLFSVLKEPFPILRVAAAAALIQSLNR